MLFTTKGTAADAPARLAGVTLVALMALAAFGARPLRAEDRKVDPWCAVIEKQMEHNRQEGLKPHDSKGTERLREERRHLDDDAHQRHCPGR